jgi:uncharacterized membrane protein
VSDRRVTVAIALLAAAGIAIAGYLTWVHYSGAKPLCLASGGCERVQGSRYSHVAGIPVAVIGLAGYLAILGSLAIRADLGRAATAFLAFVGLAFSVYLTYVELFTLEAICQWCVASALIITLIAALATVRVWRAPPAARASV